MFRANLLGSCDRYSVLCCRFYFVGDEDLLEIIGNSKNVPKLQKHFKKMFAGVATVILSPDETKVLGICSREGEEVREREGGREWRLREGEGRGRR